MVKACQKRRVLVVDDNRDAADVMAILLRGQGSDVKTAYGGQDAINLASSFQPHVILLDIEMPQVNGYQAAKSIRAAEGGGNILLIALTGREPDGERKESLAAGFDHHLVKPVSSTDVLKLLDEIIDAGE
jgi:CheY-like chemotaxis protein